ncbi:MAG: hypothetical protein QOJ65_631 [Fimbriimonadaceae bacterium]|jgi:hypothetical protein|nr:hypothetical protein [Fimbriimonadaceae bacterium]
MDADRLISVSRGFFALFLASAIVAAGCAGSGLTTGRTGEVSGVVFDSDGNVVRGARVFLASPLREATSNSSGAYILKDVPSDDVLIRAEVTQGSTDYLGQNVARVFGPDRSKSVNIVVVRANEIARIHGTVTDSSGGRVAGARVFAIGANNLSSNMAVTDANGDYTIGRLASGINYEVSAGSADFRSDGTGVTLTAGEDRDVDFVITLTSTGGNLSAPANLSAVAWTSPDDSTRSPDSASAYEAIKRLYDPKRVSRTSITRATPTGEIIEIDLTWDRIVSDFLLGYGIYRGNGTNGTLQADDFVRDPLAEFFADADPALSERATYRYAVTSVDIQRRESAFSSDVTVETLRPVTALNPLQNPLRFRWQAAAGAEEYIVYLFDEQPKVGVASIWNNESSPTTGTSLTYSGSPLVAGDTYYYVVLALANGSSSRAISRIVSFTA